MCGRVFKFGDFHQSLKVWRQLCVCKRRCRGNAARLNQVKHFLFQLHDLEGTLDGVLVYTRLCGDASRTPLFVLLKLDESRPHFNVGKVGASVFAVLCDGVSLCLFFVVKVSADDARGVFTSQLLQSLHASVTRDKLVLVFLVRGADGEWVVKPNFRDGCPERFNVPGVKTRVEAFHNKDVGEGNDFHFRVGLLLALRTEFNFSV